MMGFQVLDTENIDLYYQFHIYPVVNSSFTDVQRGQFPSISKGLTLNTFSLYEPPSLKLYVNFSPMIYPIVCWGVIFLQVLTLLILDKTFVKNVPQSVTFWERFIHAWQKSFFPFPYINWHEKTGDCSDHIEKKKAVEKEVLLTTSVNLFFNMTLLFPLVILCK